MSQDVNNIARVRWACRRGMLELDLILIPFFENHYQALGEENKKTFIKLLEEPDPDLYNWLMGYSNPEHAELAAMVRLIRQKMYA